MIVNVTKVMIMIMVIGINTNFDMIMLRSAVVKLDGIDILKK